MSGSFSGVGGVAIEWRSWLPGEPARAVVVISHGAGEHVGRYEHVAGGLTGAGLAVYALDHRGHGRSGGPRALIDRLDHAVADLDRLVVLAGEAHPGLPVFLLGHSMGGTIALRYAAAHGDRLSGMILSGPLAAVEPPPRPLALLARALSVLAPRAGAIAVDPALVSRDPEVVRRYREDPLVHHGKLPARTVVELSAAVETLPETVGRIRVPVLIAYGTDDRLCPPRGSTMVAERIGSADVTVLPLEGLHHEILNEPEQAAVLESMIDWLQARLPAGAGAHGPGPALPSGPPR